MTSSTRRPPSRRPSRPASSTRRPPPRPTATQGGRRRPSAAPPSRRPLVVVALVAAVVVVALAVALIAGAGDDGDDTTAGDGTATGTTAVANDTPATVAGAALAPLPEAGDDPAVGTAMPTLSGRALDGTDLTIPATGRPTMMMFVAHWCPHCQAEVPVVQAWVDGGGLPDGVDLVTVSTAADDRRPNYPPADWLAAEGWTAPVLVDGDNAAAEAAGLTAYPFFVAVDGDGEVVERTSGELTAAQLDAIAARLAPGGA
jgi:cytochrome c biogenesis protein CcmG, thiol:disulfide interchange protein DsbE